jgi:hypothetical protein
VRKLAHWDAREVAELARLLRELNRGITGWEEDGADGAS